MGIFQKMEPNTEPQEVQSEKSSQKPALLPVSSDVDMLAPTLPTDTESAMNSSADLIPIVQQNQEQNETMAELPNDPNPEITQPPQQPSDDVLPQQSTMEQGQEPIIDQQQQQKEDIISEQQHVQQMDTEPIIQQNQIENEPQTELESVQIEQQQQPIEPQISEEIHQNTEISQPLPLQSSDVKPENELHAQPQNEEIAAPILSEQSHQMQSDELPPNIPKNEDEQQPKVEQQATDIVTEENIDDNDQIMADNQQQNDVKNELNTEQNGISQSEPINNEQAQIQEIKQQIPEPMDTDNAPPQNDRIQTVEKSQGIKPELLACSNMLNEFMKRPETEPFNEPVDWKGLNLPDYPLIITKPMDLGTVSHKLSNAKYSTAEAFAVDVRLVFSNAMRYNQDGSGIYVVAENFSKQFERRYARITKVSANKKRKQMGTNSTFGQRQTFTTLIQNLTPQELGGVVELIDRKSPQALNDKFGADDANDDEIEIEVYNIEGPILTELIGFIEKVIAKRDKKKSRKSGYNY